MKKKLFLALLAALCLALSAQGALAAVSEKVLARAVDIIGTEESHHDYGCVEVDTNGKLSIGFLQWNANRATSLVRKIVERTGADANVPATLRSSDKAWIRDLITTAGGIEVQDEQARADISSYVETVMSLGIKDPNALCYYADIAHQVGTGGAVKYRELAAEKAGGYEKVTLEHMYQAALNYATHTKARRTRVYQNLKANPISAAREPEPDAPEGEGATLRISPAGPKTITLGETLTLSAELSTGEAAKVSWSTSDKQVARVKNGVVTPLRPGTARIRAKAKKGLSATVEVTVERPVVSEIILKGPASIPVDTVSRVKAALLPKGARSDLAWKSSNAKVLAVNSAGRIKGVKAGKATIYCRDGLGHVASLEITVFD